MPKVVPFSSSSEDEDPSPDAPTNQNVVSKESTSTKYECPTDYVSFCHKPCSSTLKDNFNNNNNELWLIKAPSSFKPQCFSGVQLPLCGMQTVRVPSTDGAEQIYSVLGSSRCSTELRLLTGHQQSGSTTLASSFSGLINICENYGDSIINQAPKIIPAAPAPTLPPGLKQRFQHLGSKTPTLTRPREEEHGKGRRKRKKDKKIKLEQQDLSVRAEPDVELQQLLLVDREVPEERRRKKKKKDREGQEEHRGLPKDSEVIVKEEDITVKSEPIDSWFGDEVEGKKKKKKSKGHD